MTITKFTGPVTSKCGFLLPIATIAVLLTEYSRQTSGCGVIGQATFQLSPQELNN